MKQRNGGKRFKLIESDEVSNRKRRGKHPICFWQRMKKVLIDLWFPNDYYDILDYTSIDYKPMFTT